MTSTTTEAPSLVGGRYALHPLPKRGRLADVFKASDIRESGNLVAVKLFRSGLVDDAVIREAFHRESSILTDLHHERIISLKDFGVDELTNRPYLILNWGGEDLTTCIDKSTVSDWDMFYDAFGRALLEGLAYAHQRGVVHRDIKPSDLLKADDGTVRLADFGIAKYREFVDTKLSIDDFRTDPFTPPNGYDPSYSYSTDVYGFAAVALDFLSTVPLSTWDDLGKALAEVQASTEVLDLLEESISKDPAERPLDATVLLSKLDRIQEIRRRTSVSRRVCCLTLTKKTLEGLRAAEGVESEAEAVALIMRDLDECRAVRPFSEQGADGEWAPREGHFSFLGANLRLHAAIDDRDNAKLVILSARRPYSSSSLEQDRDRGWDPPFDFSFSSNPSVEYGRETIRSFVQGLERFEEESAELNAVEAEGRIFRGWSDLLQARFDHVEGKASLSFSERTVEGSRVTFRVEGPTDALIIDETWLVQINTKSFLRGVVEDITDNTVTLYIEDGGTSQIPPTGTLSIDAKSTRSALKKQRDALEAVRAGNVPKPILKDRLLHPADCMAGDLPIINDWFFPELDDEKKEAVRGALAANDFYLVEGPPGTGKTSFIAELILQYSKFCPGKRILLTAQTHIAVDNAIDRVVKLKPDLRVIRVGYQEQKVAASTQKFLLQNRVKEWGKAVRQKSVEFIQGWAAENGIAFTDVELGIELGALIGLLREQESEEMHEASLRESIDLIALELQLGQSETGEHLDIVAASERMENKDILDEQLRESDQRLRSIRVAIDEARQQLSRLGDDAKALAYESPTELEEWSQQLVGSTPENEMFRNLLQISNEWIRRFGVGDDCYEAVLAASDLVTGTCIGIASVSEANLGAFDLCIFDEASKATPTETLVPLSRSKKWVLVGDTKQLPPFVDQALRDKKLLERYEIDTVMVKDTILGRLKAQLPKSLSARLTAQHRMTRAIGDLVSTVFYSGELQSMHEELNQHIGRVLPTPVTWFTTSTHDNRFETSSGASFVNQTEAIEVVNIIKRIEFYANASKGTRNNKGESPGEKLIDIVVLSGYVAQRDLIENIISKDRNSWKSVSVQCQTIDAFQGREADLAILSITRSNRSGNLGFLRQRERINVALSRGKLGLCIVGDDRFCSSMVVENPLSEVIIYMKDHVDSCTIKEISK